MSGWTVRPASANDAVAIADVLIAAGAAAWGDFLDPRLIETANRGRTHPADLVAEDGEGVAAFVAWDAATGEVLRLYTHPRARGGGAGRALLEQALEALRTAGRDQAWLNTEERNMVARRFYESLGWRLEGPPRVREWHGVELREPRYVKDL